jgi:hypothetical protein
MRAQRALSVIACAFSLAVLVHCGVNDNSNPKGAAGAGGSDGGRGGASGDGGNRSTAGNAGSSATGGGNLDAGGGNGGAAGNGGGAGRGGAGGNGGSAMGGRGGGSPDAGGASGASGSTAGNAGSSAAGAGNVDAGGGKGGAAGNGGGSGRGGTGGNGGSAIDGSADSTGRDSGTIWHPPPGTTWQWQLTGTIDTSVNAEMYDIDLFETPQGTIDALHAAGRIVICYLSAGTYEPGRPDSSSIPQAARGSSVQGWPGEEWLDTRDATVRQIMAARMDLAAQKKCDGVEPDNVDGYQNNPGFPLTSNTQLDYNKFLASEAHSRGLSVGLKNDLDQVDALQLSFDWALNEECSQYSECDMLAPFTQAGKAVFHAEYSSGCPAAVPGLSTIVKHMSLDAYRLVCP